MPDKALGMVETRGLVASIEAADAMVKAAQVTIIAKERADAGLMTILIVGETAAVKSAVEAGAAAAKKVGQLVSTHIIPRPDDQMITIFPSLKSEFKVSAKETKEVLPPKSKPVDERKEGPILISKKHVVEIQKPSAEEKPEAKSRSTDTIERLRREALGKSSEKKSKESGGIKSGSINIAELEVMNVHQLRRFARSTPGFPIQGREISRANRGELLDYFKNLL
jgi:microcompartment protein CcmL/EutN